MVYIAKWPKATDCGSVTVNDTSWVRIPLYTPAVCFLHFLIFIGMRNEKQYHFIYKTINLLNSRYYIGMHSTNDLEDGYLGSGTYLKRSLNKHGEENHKLEILEFCKTKDELKSREKELINLNEIAKKECMNLKVGGTGGFTVDQQRLNAIKSNQKQRELWKTDLVWSTKKKRNMTLGQLKSYENGTRDRIYFYDWTGKHHSDESKKKMSIKASERVGSKNSQYGTCWITNGIENKKIKKTDNPPKGYKYGRTMAM